MTARKRMLIQQAQRAIARHHEQIDYETKVLYRTVQHVAAQLTDEQLVQAVQQMVKR